MRSYAWRRTSRRRVVRLVDRPAPGVQVQIMNGLTGITQSFLIMPGQQVSAVLSGVIGNDRVVHGVRVPIAISVRAT